MSANRDAVLKVCHQAQNFVLTEARVAGDPRPTSKIDLRMTLDLPIHRDWQPGQFVMLRWGQHLTGRAFTIVEWRAKDRGPSQSQSQMQLWVRRSGESTEQLFEALKRDSRVWVTAPLGKGFDETFLNDLSKQILFLSKGAGAAATTALFEARRNHRTKAFPAPFCIDSWIHEDVSLETLCKELQMRNFIKPDHVLLNQSVGQSLSFGTQGSSSPGSLTELPEYEFAKLLPAKFTHVMASGFRAPELLSLKNKLSGLEATRGAQVLMRVDERMGCGIGLCFSCSVLTPRGPVSSCLEGPWFEASEVETHLAQGGSFGSNSG